MRRNPERRIRMGNMVFWGVVFVLAAAAEAGTLQLVSIWFAVGAVAAFFACLADLTFTAQLGVFVGVSIVLLLATRPFLNKLKVKQTPPMNAEKGIGQTAVVIQEVNPALGTGRARHNGVDWIAVSEDGSVLPVDSVVIISRIDGAKVIVRRAPASVQAEAAI